MVGAEDNAPYSKIIAPDAAVSEKRLLTSSGKVRYQLKTPYRDGTPHVIFEPLDFTALAHPCARGISASMHVIACI